jgi:hypothetical protein
METSLAFGPPVLTSMAVLEVLVALALDFCIVLVSSSLVEEAALVPPLSPAPGALSGWPSNSWYHRL